MITQRSLYSHVKVCYVSLVVGLRETEMDTKKQLQNLKLFYRILKRKSLLEP